ncbi:MAG: hypothetical protein AAGF97_16575 [Planctomycetota bacterium]
MKSRIFLSIFAPLIAQPCFGQFTQFPFPTVGVYDENIISPNEVDAAASGSLGVGQFSTMVANAYDQDFGGVAQNGFWSFYYGQSQSKIIHFEQFPLGGLSSAVNAISTGDIYATSGSSSELIFRPSSIENGLSQEHLVAFGLTVISPESDGLLQTTLTGKLDDGGELLAVADVDVDDTLFALRAPAGRYFTEVRLDYQLVGLPRRLYFDDIGFVTAQVPEPGGGVLLLTLLCVPLLRTRRRGTT